MQIKKKTNYLYVLSYFKPRESARCEKREKKGKLKVSGLDLQRVFFFFSRNFSSAFFCFAFLLSLTNPRGRRGNRLCFLLFRKDKIKTLFR